LLLKTHPQQSRWSKFCPVFNLGDIYD